MLDSDTAVRRYGLNMGLGCNVRLKEICSTSRNLHPLELGQNGANSRPQHFWFGTTWFHREKVVHIGPPPSGVPPKNITWGTFGKTGVTFRSVVRFGLNFMVDSQLDFSFYFSCNAAQKNLKKIKKNQEVIEKWAWSVFLVFGTIWIVSVNHIRPPLQVKILVVTSLLVTTMLGFAPLTSSTENARFGHRSSKIWP